MSPVLMHHLPGLHAPSTTAYSPETIDKIAATFEYYWNDREFEYYAEDQRERLARALQAEKYYDANNPELYTMPPPAALRRICL